VATDIKEIIYRFTVFSDKIKNINKFLALCQQNNIVPVLVFRLL